MFNNGPPRGGTRGGKDAFDWSDVKGDTYRENYLGHSVMAPVGRWQRGKDLSWYSKTNKISKEDLRKAEIKNLKEREEDMMREKLGLKPIRRQEEKLPELDKAEMKELLKRGTTEHDEHIHIDRVEGLGFAPAARVAGSDTLARIVTRESSEAPQALEGTVDASSPPAKPLAMFETAKSREEPHSHVTASAEHALPDREEMRKKEKKSKKEKKEKKDKKERKREKKEGKEHRDRGDRDHRHGSLDTRRRREESSGRSSRRNLDRDNGYERGSHRRHDRSLAHSGRRSRSPDRRRHEYVRREAPDYGSSSRRNDRDRSYDRYDKDRSDERIAIHTKERRQKRSGRSRSASSSSSSPPRRRRHDSDSD